ncbi:14813_t:CDS:2, partial [Gigaspora margarita]
HDKLQEHQLSLLSQPLVSIELSKPSQVQKDVTPLTQKNNVNTNRLLSELVKRHPNIYLSGRLSRMPSESSDIMKSEDFDHIKEESENRSLNEEMGVLIQINELFNKESIVFQNQIKELKMKLKIANQKKRKNRANKLLELPASNKKAKHEKIASDDDDSDSKGARSAKSLFAQNDKQVRGYNKNEVLALFLNTEVHYPEISETNEN